MSEKAFTMDFSHFARDFDRITKKEVPADIEKAYWELGWRILKDANTKEPKTPRDIGDLQSSGMVKFNMKDDFELLAGFNKVYAAKWHELPKELAGDINWSLMGSGPKFLESKMSMYKDDYVKFVADRIKG